MEIARLAVAFSKSGLGHDVVKKELDGSPLFKQCDVGRVVSSRMMIVGGGVVHLSL
jgi:hypothetical protein